MTDFVIEKGVPLPPLDYRNGGRPLLHRWDLLKVGESVVVPTNGAARSGQAWARNHGRRFIQAKQTREPRGYRVWRVE